MPLKWPEERSLGEITSYLAALSQHAEVLVVDGSPESVFRQHRREWGGFCRHFAPHVDLRFSNGKVNGVLSGLREASHENVIIADDDVRYNEENLRCVDKLLAVAELVLPQNYFDPLPWHAKWDTARILLNRALAHDYPGTLAVRRSFLLNLGGYNGDVLFENLELIRTVKAGGGTAVHVPDLFVRRLPPDVRQFWSQRVRQAYDDFAQPWRLAGFGVILPLGFLGAKKKPALLGAAAAASSALAEAGRRRDSGRRVFPPAAPLFAPVWLLERGACVWAAISRRVFWGGCRYGDRVIRRAASPLGELKDRFAVGDLASGVPVESDSLV